MEPLAVEEPARRALEEPVVADEAARRRGAAPVAAEEPVMEQPAAVEEPVRRRGAAPSELVIEEPVVIESSPPSSRSPSSSTSSPSSPRSPSSSRSSPSWPRSPSWSRSSPRSPSSSSTSSPSWPRSPSWSRSSSRSPSSSSRSRPSSAEEPVMPEPLVRRGAARRGRRRGLLRGRAFAVHGRRRRRGARSWPSRTRRGSWLTSRKSRPPRRSAPRSPTPGPGGRSARNRYTATNSASAGDPPRRSALKVARRDVCKVKRISRTNVASTTHAGVEVTFVRSRPNPALPSRS